MDKLPLLFVLVLIHLPIGAESFDEGPGVAPRPSSRQIESFGPSLQSDFNSPDACARVLELAAKQPFKRLQKFESLEVEPIARQARVAVQDQDLLALTIQAGLAAANLRSQQLTALQQSPTVDPATQFFDIIFIGAGSAELTAQLTRRKLGLEAKTITLESDEVVARTFYSTRAFYTNSTDGPSASDERPLPNLGLNLNKVPNGFVQTSNFQNEKYASAGVLGDTLAINRLLLDAPFMFNQSVECYRPTPEAQVRLGFPKLMVRLKSGKTFYGHVVMQATGLGTERSSASSPEGRAFVEEETNRFLYGGARPRYFSSIRFFNYVTWAEQPYRPFVNETVIVIGKGNFANVECEYFERGGPPEGYKNDTLEVGRYRQVIWIAPGIVKTCEAFSSTNRTRYLSSIPAGLQKGRIVTIDGKSLDIRPGPDGRPRVTYLDEMGREQTIDGDTVIDAIGFKSETISETEGRDVIADLPKTKNAVIAREVYPGAYRMGVASGAPVTTEELAKNDENRASLYLNLVRVEALMNLVAKTYGAQFGKLPPLPRQTVLPTTSGTGPAYAETFLVNPDSFVKGRDFAPWFVQTLLELAMRELDLPDSSKITLEIYGQAEPSGVRFVSGGMRVNTRFVSNSVLERVLSALTSTPAFYSVLSESVPDAGTVRMSFDISRVGAKFAVDIQMEPQPSLPAVQRSAAKILLGFRTPQPLAFQVRSQASKPPATPLLETQKPGRSPAYLEADRKYRAKLSSLIDDTPGRRPTCFTGRMCVATPRGERPIAELRVGDEVFSFDHQTSRLVSNRIAKILVAPGQAYSTLRTDAPNIQVTGRHRFFSMSRNAYAAISDILPTETLLRLRNFDLRSRVVPEPLARGSYGETDGVDTVYNLELEGEPRNYFVHEVLVHNAKESI